MNKPRLLMPLSICVLVASAAHAQQAWHPLPAHAPEPPGNVGTPAKVDLGRTLFFDKRLSESGTVSCASCHNLKDGGADHYPSSLGVHGQRDGRNALTVWNVAFMTSYFWDGRAASLEEQAAA